MPKNIFWATGLLPPYLRVGMTKVPLISRSGSGTGNNRTRSNQNDGQVTTRTTSTEQRSLGKDRDRLPKCVQHTSQYNKVTQYARLTSQYDKVTQQIMPNGAEPRGKYELDSAILSHSV